MSELDSAKAAETVRAAFYQTPGARKISALSKERGIPIYLTGGFVRDTLLNRKDNRDLDFSIKADASGAAAEWAGMIGGSIVPLDPERGTFRVAKKIEGLLWCWDFTLFRGKDILADLSLRDFTINSLALSLWPDSEGFLDPTGGLHDLDSKIIRHTHPETFEDDPVRRLRAYRFAAQLGLRIDPSTRGLLRGDDLTPTVSGERIREELSALLSSRSAASSMKEVVKGKLLGSLWPEGGPDLMKLLLFEDFIETFSDSSRTGVYLSSFLDDRSTHGLSLKTLLKLLCLAIPKGSVTKDSQRESYRLSAHVGKTLILGRRATKFQKLVLNALMSLTVKPDLFVSQEGPWIYFDSFGRSGIGALVLLTAFGGAKKASLATLDKMIAFYNHRYLPDLKKDRLVSAWEISSLTGTQPGPLLGELLQEINMARRLGLIKNAQEAAVYLKEFKKN